MADVKSKNLYELLGNDHDEDSDKEPEPPVKVVDKPVARTTKRNAPDTAPAEPRGGLGGDRGGRGGRRGGFTGSEDAFRDRNTGSTNNRSKPTEDGFRQDRHPDRLGGGARQGNSEGRGGRAGRSGRGGARGGRDDRHSRGFPHDHAKQADQSWGAPTGGSEWDDEKAGEAIAKAEEKAEGFDAAVEPPVDAEGNKLTTTEEAVPLAALITEPEPEDNSKSYADYLAEQAEKKLQLGTGALEARKPNEGSKQDKKWAQAKPLKKDDEEDAYIAGKGEKAKRERQKKEKNVVDVDLRYVEPQRGGGDRGRGGRGRGEGRGDYRGGDRGRGGRGRGDGYRGRGDGGYRGGRGGRDDHAVNPSDTNAFPSLGGS